MKPSQCPECPEYPNSFPQSAMPLSEIDVLRLFAYPSEQCAGQEAVMIADPVVAPYPLSLVKPPLKCMDESENLPLLGVYRIKLLCAPGCSEPLQVLARHVVAAFAAYH
ncbi:hypothetical protein [Stutzerimonas stutzeri]|uniref:hypothetical protein n=1 Tax=Stutzerimonas stutzeri TaxID=316 RepID=UPI002109406C|nr:hypothetical protein [Stutzerimonas stutzeri]MCQ4320210.1 hypothetical protein [Stutzerimonas stutzeri]